MRCQNTGAEIPALLFSSEAALQGNTPWEHLVLGWELGPDMTLQWPDYCTWHHCLQQGNPCFSSSKNKIKSTLIYFFIFSANVCLCLYVILDKLRKESIFCDKPGIKINYDFLSPAEITWLWMSVQQLTFPVLPPSRAGSLYTVTAGNGKDDTHSFPLFCLMSESLMRTITLASINTPCKREKYWFLFCVLQLLK